MSTPVNSSVQEEASVFGFYLVKQQPPQDALRLYEKALAAQPVSLSAKDKRLLEFAIAHPWSIGLIDAGLCFVSPLSEVRRRLYTMFSILETQPTLADTFLPQKHGPLYIVVIGLCGIRAVIKAVVGILLIKALVR